MTTHQDMECVSEMVAEAVSNERTRCAEIVQLARSGDIDGDFRAIISLIEGGLSVEQIKEFSR